MNFDEELRKKTGEVEKILGMYLPKPEGFQSRVLEAMAYAVSAGGKRLRPLMMAETAALFGGAGESLSCFMAAIEFIHTYSLIHDDLPALDNDDYRRGSKTTHVVYGEDIAVIAGDGLLNYAFETALRAFGKAVTLEDYQRIEVALNILGKKAGVYGMIGGQCADLLAERPEAQVTEETLLFIHENKTAALIQAAMTVGAVLAGADEKAVASLEKCAGNIGVAFQIQDDILDVTGTPEQLGKPVLSDEKNQKTTYVTLEGLEKAREDVARISAEALKLLHSLPGENLFLEELIQMLVTREK